MTEKVQYIIDGIRLKCKALHSQLVQERSIRMNQEAELTSLKSEILILKDQNNGIELELGRFKMELETIEKQRIENNISTVNGRNSEIDDLVREIEHCINQLKQ